MDDDGMNREPSWYEFRNLVCSKEFNRAERLLSESPEILGETNSIGETVLHFLAVENDFEGVTWLHSRGASLNTKNKFGEPLVFEVAERGHKELLLWLAHNGADLSVRDGRNRSLLEYLRRDLDKVRPEWPSYQRMQDRRRRSDEIEQFLVENLPHVLRDDEPR
jgi:hypothetical protein